MTAFAALSLTNSAATAVAFNPTSIDSSGVAKWLTNETAFDAKRAVTSSLTLPKGGSSVVRLKQRVTIPTMDAVDTTKRIGESYVNIEYVVDKRAALATRLDLQKFVDSLTLHASTTAALTSFEGQY